jgi:hypothetical protein
MNKKKIYLVVSACMVLLFFSCKLIMEKEVFIKPSEVGVYYDESADKMTVLNAGKHAISKNVPLYIYSLQAKNVKENSLVLTKDGKQITCNVNYWYSLNAKTILKLHLEIGEDFNDRLIRPKIVQEMRTSFGKYVTEDIKVANIEKAIRATLKNDKEFSKFIRTKSFKLKIESEKK